jgi:hypothetical protein
MILFQLKYLISFFCFLITFFFSFQVNAEKNIYSEIDNLKKFEYCNLDLKNLTKIDVNINRKDKWNRNLIKANLSKNNDGQVINERYKKRYKSKLLFYTKNKIKCILNAKVRINGDWKDHIDLSEPNNYKVSLDVKITEGNFNGIRDFKLFIPTTKGGDKQIIYLNILKHLGFISPQSFKTNISINSINEGVYNFVEKPSKELIEKNNLNEGPILIVDERSIWDEAWKNQRSNSFLYLFKIKNKNWSDKNLITKKITLDALNILNSIYLNLHAYQLDYHPYIAQKINTLNYNLNNKLNYDYSEVYKFDLVSTAFGARYALIPNNRKFYFNSINNKFYPIPWDTMPKFDIEKYIFSSPLNVDFIDEVIEIIKSININNLLKDINESNIKLSKEELSKIINNSIINLKLNIFQKDTNELQTKLQKAFFPQTLKNFSKYFTNSKVFIPEHLERKFVFSNFKNGKLFLYRCENNILENCKNLQVPDNIFFNYIFDNELIYINDLDVYFNEDIEKLVRTNLNSKNMFSGKILSTLNVEFDHDEANREINIYAPKNSYVVFNKAKIEDYRINLYSSDNENHNNYFIDAKGCLNIYDSIISKTKINIFDSHCEDALNIVNTNGDIDTVNILNSFSDGVDFDFSQIKIKNLSVKNAGNDCVDFSFGNYFIENIIVENCNDKGISIGEKSKFFSKKINAKNTNITLAAKDASDVKIDYLASYDSNFCLAAYVKKNEFYGSLINIKNKICESQDFKDKYSIINYE